MINATKRYVHHNGQKYKIDVRFTMGLQDGKPTVGDPYYRIYRREEGQWVSRDGWSGSSKSVSSTFTLAEHRIKENSL